MSATGRGAKRRQGDAYYTPDALAAQLVGLLDIAPDSRVIEPSVGGGAFARALRDHWVYGIDVDPEAAGFRDCDIYHPGDFLDTVLECDWVIGNPPYGKAEAHVRHALQCAPRVAFLLRLAFLESVKRAPFWMEHPPSHVHVLSRRPSFTQGGTDSCAYGWFVWIEGWGPASHIHITGE